MTNPRRWLTQARGTARLTQAALARAVGVDPATVSRWERGAQGIYQRHYALLATALDLPAGRVETEEASRLGGADREAGLVLDHDGEERLALAISDPARVDQKVLDDITTLLDMLRRVEDRTGPAVVLSTVLAQLAMVEQLTAGAPSQHRAGAVSLIAHWAQFLGWVRSDLGDIAQADAAYNVAMDAAHQLADPDMLVSVLSLKSHLAWGKGDGARAMALADAGMGMADEASSAVRALMAQQSARSQAMTGATRATVDRLLDEATTAAIHAAEYPDKQAPWVYFLDPDRLVGQRGLAYAELGLYRQSAEHLERSLSCLAGYPRDHSWYSARAAVCWARAGERERAGELAAGLTATGSAHVAAELAELDRLLAA